MPRLLFLYDSVCQIQGWCCARRSHHCRGTAFALTHLSCPSHLVLMADICKMVVWGSECSLWPQIVRNLMIWWGILLWVRMLQSSCSQLEAILCPRGNLKMSGDMFGYHNWETGGATVISCVETRDPGNVLQRTRRLPQQRIIQPQLSVVLRSRNPALERVAVLTGRKWRVKIRTYLLARQWLTRCQMSNVSFYSFFHSLYSEKKFHCRCPKSIHSF